MPRQEDVTLLLNAAAEGGRSALDRLMPLVYAELRQLAEAYLRLERPDHTLQATSLVHEAYARLVDQTRVVWKSREHFFAVSATAVRRILVDHARTRSRQKRGGGRPALSLDDAPTLAADSPGTEVLALDEALTRLSCDHPDKARVVEMRFFGGMTVDETAVQLGVTTRTVERYWEFARAWLFRELEHSDAADAED